MKFEAKHAGKWVAIKNDKVIASGTSLKKLTMTFEHTKDVRFTLIPKGFIAV